MTLVRDTKGKREVAANMAVGHLTDISNHEAGKLNYHQIH